MRSKKELTRDDILHYLHLLNEKLKEDNQHGDVMICGGAALALAYSARDATYDIDALYRPKELMDGIIQSIAREHKITSQWLNDDVSMFISELKVITSSPYLTLSNLIVSIVDAKWLLSMKLLAAREESHDLTDAVVLIKHLQIKSVEKLYELIDEYKGRYHPDTLHISRIFAQAALRQANQ